MRIIGINGAWSYRNPIWRNLEEAFCQRFECREFVVEEERGCQPWEYARLKRFATKIVQLNDDGMDTLLVGHSLGGVTACAIANQFKYSRVCGIVTIFSPHQFLFGAFPRLLGATEKLEVPVVSFGARYDEAVWWGAHHPQARAHFITASNHFSDLVVDSRFAHQIAQESKSVLFPQT